MIIKLTRFAYTPMGTFGRLYVPELELYTVERPWTDNQPKVSCIPEGAYPLRASRFNRGGYDTWQIMDVPDRSLIKIHIGNTMDDLLGCIAPGRGLGWVHGKWAVTQSGVAFRQFMSMCSRLGLSDHERIEIRFSKYGG